MDVHRTRQICASIDPGRRVPGGGRPGCPVRGERVPRTTVRLTLRRPRKRGAPPPGPVLRYWPSESPPKTHCSAPPYTPDVTYRVRLEGRCPAGASETDILEIEGTARPLSVRRQRRVGVVRRHLDAAGKGAERGGRRGRKAREIMTRRMRRGSGRRSPTTRLGGLRIVRVEAPTQNTPAKLPYQVSRAVFERSGRSAWSILRLRSGATKMVRHGL